MLNKRLTGQISAVTFFALRSKKVAIKICSVSRALGYRNKEKLHG